MDFIKETYDLLNHHLGVEHRGSKRLDPEHGELKKDIQTLVIHALNIGKVLGADAMKLVIEEDHYRLMNATSPKYAELRRAVIETRYKSRSIKSG